MSMYTHTHIQNYVDAFNFAYLNLRLLSTWKRRVQCNEHVKHAIRIFKGWRFSFFLFLFYLISQPIILRNICVRMSTINNWPMSNQSRQPHVSVSLYVCTFLEGGKSTWPCEGGLVVWYSFRHQPTMISISKYPNTPRTKCWFGTNVKKTTFVEPGRHIVILTEKRDFTCHIQTKSNLKQGRKAEKGDFL